jgi:hypothetical protein
MPRLTRRTKLALLGVSLAAAMSGSVVLAAFGREDEPMSSEELAADIVAESSDAQRAALADGAISEGEYHAASQNAAACIEAGGVTVELREASSGTLDLVMTYPIEMEQGADELIRRCVEEHRSSVGRVWASQNLPSEADVADLHSRLEECLTAAGQAGLVDVTYHRAVEQFGTASEEAGALESCWKQVLPLDAALNECDSKRGLEMKPALLVEY